MSSLSRAKPPGGPRRACIFSVKTAGSREDAPYTALVDLSTKRRTDGARWQAASSCIVPMTLSSFIGPRPPEPAGVELMFMCTTVSTPAVLMTLPISGLRMSARTNSVRPRRRSSSADGGTVSTPMTRSMAGSRASSAASAPPSHRLTPVTRTTAGGTSLSSLLVATLHAGLLQQLAVLLLRHPLAALLDDRTHVLLPTSWPRVAPGATRAEPDATRVWISSCATAPAGAGVSLGVRAYPAPPRRRCRGNRAGRNSPWRGRGTASLQGPAPSGARRGGREVLTSGDVGVGVAQVVLDGALRDAEGAADTDGGQLAGVHEAVHGHLGDAHHARDLGDGQEGDGGAGLRDDRAADGHRGGVGRADRAGHRGGR